jgi:radical SAM-linked protein
VESATAGAGGAVQRWRVRYAIEASDPGLSQRDEADAWARALEAASLPLARAAPRRDRPDPNASGGRLRVSFGPPLPAGAEATDEPLEILLTERRPVADVRSELTRVAPHGRRLVDVHDVWLRAPALAALIRELEYRIEVAGAVEGELGSAAAALLRAETLPRDRTRGQRARTFDLRPLVAGLEVEEGGVAGEVEGKPAAVLVFHASVDTERGVGRPDDLLAALAERMNRAIEPIRTIRTRVRLADDDGPRCAAPGGARPPAAPA